MIKPMRTLTLAAPVTTGASNPAETVARMLTAETDGYTAWDAHGYWRDAETGETASEPVRWFTVNASADRLAVIANYAVALLALAGETAAYLASEPGAVVMPCTDVYTPERVDETLAALALPPLPRPYRRERYETNGRQS